MAGASSPSDSLDLITPLAVTETGLCVSQIQPRDAVFICIARYL